MDVGGFAVALNRVALAALSLMLTVAGCAHDAESSKSAPATSTVTVTSQAPSDQPKPGDINSNGTPDTSDQDWPGTMIATYEDAASPEAVTGRDLMRNENLLEDLAAAINSSLKLPQDVPLIGKECGEANAYWSVDDKSMTICYEDAAEALQIYTDDGDPDPVASAINSEVATFYHETGHMAIDLYELPITGREEDVADQLAAYVLLTPGDDGTIDPASVQAVKDFAREFQGYSERDGEIDEGQLSDTHSLDKTRMYNLECWVYGADPVGNEDLVTDGSLPRDRADGCQDEYEKLSDAWSSLLSPYFK